MHINAKKVIWSIVAILCVVGIALLWLVGLPVPDYAASTDNAPPTIHTIKIAPDTYFDVAMSSDEKLLRTDMETYYGFEQGTISKVGSYIDADIVDAQKQVFGRPNSFLYRIFDDCTILVDSELSMSQAYEALIQKEPYTVHGNFEDLVLSKSHMPEYDPYTTDYTIIKGIYACRDYDYTYDEENKQLLWMGANSTFYKVQTVYGLQYDVIQQMLSTAKACYGLDLAEYYAGEDYYLFISGRWVLGVKYINRNTQLMVVTNSPAQRNSALMTIQKGRD